MVHDDWGDIAARHAVWDLTADAGELRERTAALVDRLARLRDAVDLTGDPWHDPGFAARMSRRLGELLPADLTLSGREAALLVTAPLLYDTLWSELAAAERPVGPHDLTPSQDASSDRATFERFAQTYAQPYRRAIAAAKAERRDIGEQIGWWLLHRWIGRRPAAYQPASVVHLIGEENGPFEPSRLA